MIKAQGKELARVTIEGDYIENGMYYTAVDFIVYENVLFVSPWVSVDDKHGGLIAYPVKDGAFDIPVTKVIWRAVAESLVRAYCNKWCMAVTHVRFDI